MKKLFCMVTLLALGNGCLAASGNQAVFSLIERLIPGKSSKFIVEKMTTQEGKDVYELESRGGKIVLRGNNANSQAMALGRYLKYHCKTSVSWYVDNPVKVPEKLPMVPSKERQVCSYKHRFFFNYCTFGYTMPFWKWDDWERCIDWMAINGINMPLAITGTEKVLQAMWREQGFTDEQIRGFFTGPAHLPWLHMNMIAKWGGPCPQSYIDHGYKLQKKIVKRERELGMKPILPAFSGRVPLELQKKYPDKKISVLGTGWHMFKKPYYTYFLDPYDPLFAKLQKSFMDNMIKFYGTDHYYGVDPFNEVTPPSWDLDYLAKTSRTIYDSMAAVDKDAVWMQMGWLFYFDNRWTNDRVKSLITSVPHGKLIMLDYVCERTEIWPQMDNFFDVPFIWCYLGNFGGREQLVGPLQTARDRMHATREALGDKNMWGVGSTLEGFSVNQVAFEFVFEEAWKQQKSDLSKWFRDYARSRGGKQKDAAFESAWQQLHKIVYSRGGRTNGGGAIFHSRPRLTGTKGFAHCDRHYTPEQLMSVWKEMMKVKPETTKADGFRYDVVNLVRQYLGDFALRLRDEMNFAYNMRNKKRFRQLSDQFLQLILDQDEILQTRTEFLFGKWADDARALGVTDAEKNKYEENARNLLTTWGPVNIGLTEYGNRDWAGLTKGYYYGRWKMFVDGVNLALDKGKDFDFNSFEKDAIKFEWDWVTKDRTRYTAVPVGDTWKVAKKLFAKYKDFKIPARSQAVKRTIAKWKPAQLQDGKFASLQWNITSEVQQPGIYMIHFIYKNGKKALKMKNLQLKCNDTLIAEDRHEGYSGHAKHKNVFRLLVKDTVPGAKYTLHVDARGDGGTDSAGEIVMEFYPKK